MQTTKNDKNMLQLTACPGESVLQFIKPSLNLRKPEGPLATVMPFSSIMAVNKEVKEVLQDEPTHGNHERRSLLRSCCCSSLSSYSLCRFYIRAHTAQETFVHVEINGALRGRARSHLRIFSPRNSGVLPNHESFLPRMFSTIRYHIKI